MPNFGKQWLVEGWMAEPPREAILYRKICLTSSLFIVNPGAVSGVDSLSDLSNVANIPENFKGDELQPLFTFSLMVLLQI